MRENVGSPKDVSLNNFDMFFSVEDFKIDKSLQMSLENPDEKFLV